MFEGFYLGLIYDLFIYLSMRDKRVFPCSFPSSFKHSLLPILFLSPGHQVAKAESNSFPARRFKGSSRLILLLRCINDVARTPSISNELSLRFRAKLANINCGGTPRCAKASQQVLGSPGRNQRVMYRKPRNKSITTVQPLVVLLANVHYSSSTYVRPL